MRLAGTEIRKPIVPDAIVTVDDTANGQTLSALLTAASSSLSAKAVKVWIQNVGTGDIQFRFHSTTLANGSAAVLEPKAMMVFSNEDIDLATLRFYALSGSEKMWVLQEKIA